MQHFDYKPHGVCPMNISFVWTVIPYTTYPSRAAVTESGNQPRGRGMTVEQIEGYFKGISCNGRAQASDQLATAVQGERV
ncbi:MAG: hypothetical protein ACLT2F_08135 [Butyricicoccus sp.]